MKINPKNVAWFFFFIWIFCHVLYYKIFARWWPNTAFFPFQVRTFLHLNDTRCYAENAWLPKSRDFGTCLPKLRDITVFRQAPSCRNHVISAAAILPKSRDFGINGQFSEYSWCFGYLVKLWALWHIGCTTLNPSSVRFGTCGSTIECVMLNFILFIYVWKLYSFGIV